VSVLTSAKRLSLHFGLLRLRAFLRVCKDTMGISRPVFLGRGTRDGRGILLYLDHVFDLAFELCVYTEHILLTTATK
jgi:hypothetical protein